VESVGGGTVLAVDLGKDARRLGVLEEFKSRNRVLPGRRCPRSDKDRARRTARHSDLHNERVFGVSSGMSIACEWPCRSFVPQAARCRPGGTLSPRCKVAEGPCERLPRGLDDAELAPAGHGEPMAVGELGAYLVRRCTASVVIEEAAGNTFNTPTRTAWAALPRCREQQLHAQVMSTCVSRAVEVREICKRGVRVGPPHCERARVRGVGLLQPGGRTGRSR